MQKLLIIRGHSGSGKTTFAKQKIIEFNQEYPDSWIFHIENDHYLTENGQYHWTPKRFKLAQKQATQALRTAFLNVKQSPSQHILIIISNVGINRSRIQQWISHASELAMTIEIYRLQNFFHNQHQVSLNKILKMYIALQNAPLDNEILIPPIKPAGKALQDRLAQLKLKQEQIEHKIHKYLRNFDELDTN